MAKYTSEYFISLMKEYDEILNKYGFDSDVAKQKRISFLNLIDDYGKDKDDFDNENITTFIKFIHYVHKSLKTNKSLKDIPELKNGFDRASKYIDNLEQDINKTNPNNIEENKIDENETFEKDKRIRSDNSDQNQYLLNRVALEVYLDMGFITKEQFDKKSVQDSIETLSKIPNLEGKKEIEFSEKFINKIIENNELFNAVPPKTLANAYVSTRDKIKSNTGDTEHLKKVFQKITDRIDSLSDDFKNNIGFYYADNTNIADVYEGYNAMFDCRLSDLDKEKDKDKIEVIKDNKNSLEKLIKDYDENYGITNLEGKDADKLEERYNNIKSILDKTVISDDVLKLAGQYKFLDKDDKIIGQFLDKDGNLQEEFTKDSKIDKNGQLNRIIELAKNDIAFSNVGKGENIDKAELEKELNERILFKLFEIDTAEKIVKGADEHPEHFSDPKFLENFLNNLGKNGGKISETGYESAVDQQVNNTAGYLGRVKQKLKDDSLKANGFFTKAFKSISDIDKRAKDRLGIEKANIRKKRMDYSLRLLKGFGSAFLVSAAITTIATAGAAIAGVSVALSVATAGIIVGMTMSAIQINKWRKKQKKAGLPSDLKTLLKDKKMLSTLGTTALASIGMIFGVAGLSEAAIALGYGSLAIGGTTNSINMYKDARKFGMSKKEAIAWSLANVAATVAGGITGRAVASHSINSYNHSEYKNEIFQDRTDVIIEGKEDIVNTSEVYSDESLRNAKSIAESWYRDNPVELQHRVDLINAYNLEHGTNIDPYRAIMLNADAGGRTFDNMALHIDGGGVEYSNGNHNVINNDIWKAKYGFSDSEMNALKGLFDGGQVNPEGIEAAIRADRIVSSNNEVGSISYGNSPHYDGVLPRNTVDINGNPVFDTYADGESAFRVDTSIDTVDKSVEVSYYTPLNETGMGMFGFYPETEEDFIKIEERAGTILDKIKKQKKNKSKAIPKLEVPAEKIRSELPEDKPIESEPLNPVPLFPYIKDDPWLDEPYPGSDQPIKTKPEDKPIESEPLNPVPLFPYIKDDPWLDEPYPGSDQPIDSKTETTIDPELDIDEAILIFIKKYADVCLEDGKLVFKIKNKEKFKNALNNINEINNREFNNKKNNKDSL